MRKPLQYPRTVLTASNSRQAIRSAIEAAGLTQEAASEAIGITAVTMSRWLTGVHDPPFAKLELLAKHLGHPLVLSFGDDEEAAPPDWGERLLRGIFALEAKGGITDAELAQAQARVAIYLAAGTQKPPRPKGGGAGGASSS